MNRKLTVLIATALCAAIVAPTFAGKKSKKQKLIFKKCSKTEKSKIKTAVAWLQDNFSKVDAKMGKNGLKKWPGNSKKKFKKKLYEKTLKFKCISHKNKCQKLRKGMYTLLGRVVPVLHQRRIALCTINLPNNAYYVSVIAHEIGHLVRINKHRTKCHKRYEKPRFSQSLGLAAFHAHESTRYRSSDYTRYCK